VGYGRRRGGHECYIGERTAAAANETQSQSVLAVESKGLSQSQPVAQTQEPDAIAIPDKDTKKKVTKPVNSTVKPREPEPQPSNQVPFGEGGPAATFSAAGGQGAMSFSGGSGDFGSRYGYYVHVVQQKVSENWLKYEVDPRSARGVGYMYRLISRAAASPRIYK